MSIRYPESHRIQSAGRILPDPIGFAVGVALLDSDSTSIRLLKIEKSKNRNGGAFVEYPISTMQQSRTTEESKPTNISFPNFVSFDPCSTDKCPLVDIQEKLLMKLESKVLITKKRTKDKKINRKTYSTRAIKQRGC